MLKRMSVLASLVAVAVLALAAMAPAASAEEPAPDLVIGGAGVLDAHGSGLAAVKGRMALNVTADQGVLLVKDIAGDADVFVRGQGGSVTWNGFDVYFGFDGEARVKGSNVAVIVVGKDIDLHVVGKGWAYLKGRGTVEVRGFGTRPWTDDGTFAGVGDPE